MLLLSAELSARDVAILRDLDRVRLLTGAQLERLHFADLVTANARSSARRRSLHRLVELKLVTTLPRRVGGVRAGSAGLVYTLDSRAQRERHCWDDQPFPPRRIRRPWAVGWQFVAHGLDVAELYVRLRERERSDGQTLRRFDAEPAAWFSSPKGTIKPDAYAIFDDDRWEQHRWIEVDRATESLPTIRRKLGSYVELATTGSAGPIGVLPSLLVTVPDDRRRRHVEAVARDLIAPANFVEVDLFSDALVQPGRPPP